MALHAYLTMRVRRLLNCAISTVIILYKKWVKRHCSATTIYQWHVGQSDMPVLTHKAEGKIGFECRFIKTRKRHPCIRRLKLRYSQVPKKKQKKKNTTKVMVNNDIFLSRRLRNGPHSPPPSKSHSHNKPSGVCVYV